ncbi:M56 family metallopeptidase [Algoriphagus machipongonensis]|uniref:TonB protein n=1 Tax=Algoriphagus machipongonensis TaxID=388413 RepID=A3I3B1_9BACT|nr:M56 family metallopeptidase [Algoriphagus machipongonensis]EAZ79137.1 TonB protein [Algoriphagus machipongonensis]
MEYLLKSMLCLVILLLIHRLFLQKEVMHQFNRFFLLGAVVFSFIIPFNSIEVASEKEEVAYTDTVETEFSNEFVLPEQSITSTNFAVETSNTSIQPIPWNEILWSIYGLITLGFLIRFIRNIKLILDQAHQNLQVIYKGITLVLIPKASLPFSFLSYVFVSKTDFENGELTDAIIEHEYTHVKEGHSYDILFLEFLLIPFWFHPGLYLAKHAIRLNHEFIADQKALKTTSLDTYQKMLLALASQEVRFSLVSNLNFSLTKKRLKMMNKQSDPFQKWLKLLVMIPVLGAMVYVFSEKVEAQATEAPIESKEQSTIENEIKIIVLNSNKFIYNGATEDFGDLAELLKALKSDDLLINLYASSNTELGVIQDYQTEFREAGINKIKYSSLDEGVKVGSDKPSFGKDKHYRNATFFVENEKSELVKKSYDMLSDEEKKMLVFVPSTPKKSSPTSEEFESFKNSEDFAVWLDGKHIQNTELEKINHSEIVHVFNSFVHTNARSERFPQEHQIHLYTEEGFEKTYGPSSGFTAPLTKEDKLYLYPSENRVNRGMPWPKKNDSPIAEYREKLKIYELDRNLQPHFINRPQAEQQELLARFSELGSLYYRIPLELKQTTKRPVHPYAPFVKLESENGVYYKLWEDLTEDEKSQLPQPPPPASKDRVTAYQQIYLKYELLSQEGRKYSTKPMADRELMFELFNSLQEQFLSLNAVQRRQVKRVNFPYIPMVENGMLSFKVVDELTPEQRALAGC